MQAYEVGELLFPGQASHPEGAVFEYTESGPMLIFAFRRPTAAEIEGTKSGLVELALYESPPVLFILHRVKGLERWSDSPFSIRMYDGRGMDFDWSEPVEGTAGLLLHIALVDADTGILLAQRVVSTSNQFARELRAAIMRQLEAPFSAEEYHSKVDQIYSRHSSQDLLRRATVKHKAGGK